MKQQPKVSEKTKQFLEEFKELQVKYQYLVTPELKFTVAGIIPVFSIKDKIPAKGKSVVKLKHETATPK